MFATCEVFQIVPDRRQVLAGAHGPVTRVIRQPASTSSLRLGFFNANQSKSDPGRGHRELGLAVGHGAITGISGRSRAIKIMANNQREIIREGPSLEGGSDLSRAPSVSDRSGSLQK